MDGAWIIVGPTSVSSVFQGVWPRAISFLGQVMGRAGSFHASLFQLLCSAVPKHGAYQGNVRVLSLFFYSKLDWRRDGKSSCSWHVTDSAAGLSNISVSRTSLVWRMEGRRLELPNTQSSFNEQEMNYLASELSESSCVCGERRHGQRISHILYI